jgi:nucleotide-binding universal stress UspA family protein
MSKVHIGKRQSATGRMGTSHAGPAQTGTITTKVPARLDRLPWSRWHWMVIIGLGTVWILDGLEVTGDDNRIAAESALRDAVRDALGEQADGAKLRTIQGLAGRQLVETAAQAGAELIVLASRGSVSLLPGTVSQYALRNAPCPVLVVPGGRGSG